MPDNKIICFQQDTKERKRFFKAASFAHPAKMVLGLQIYLIEHYTKPGDTILDPMAGSGTILMACTLGRNVVLVELEDKFVKMQQDNYEKIKSLGPMLGFTMGAATILQGDARNLDGLLADGILFSPPYGDINYRGESDQKYKDAAIKTGKLPKMGSACHKVEYSKNSNNIGNLPYGEIKAVICSPPFGEAHNQKGLGVGDNDRKDLRDYSYLKTDTKGQIGNLPYGKADAIVTSPPYEESVGHTGKDNHPIIQEKSLALRGSLGYGDRQNDNIGNLKSENYLEAMLQVYRQCHIVLKPEGIMVLVTKNFIRDKKVIRLDLDTIKLCEQAGFKLKETLKRKLTSQSFWRTIYHNKYPDVEKIEYEDVLIFEKEV